MNTQMKQKKAVLAAYLNMAQQNMVITLQHISKLMGVDEVIDFEEETNEASQPEKGKMKRSFDINQLQLIKELKDGAECKSERALKVINLLYSHFPIFKAYSMARHKQKNFEMTPSAFRKLLINIYTLLNTYRNRCSHESPTEPSVNAETEFIKLQKEMAKYLFECLNQGSGIIRNRFKDSFSDKEFDAAFMKAGISNEEKEKPKKPVKGKQAEKKNNADCYYRLTEADGGGFSYTGLVLFVCLFLHKKYITMFLDQSSLFNSDFMQRPKEVVSKSEKAIIRELFGLYRIRLPKERIESTLPDYALGLDMLNELQKCPKELYKVLSDADKALFRVKSKDEEETDTEDNEKGDVLLMRYSDRFPYFALRYMDECKVFNDIRFQVSLGKYRYAFYDKACIDTVEKDRLRSLQKEINGFGRLKEIESMRMEKWGEHIDYSDENRKPYITDQRAGYLFNGNRIGFLFNNEELQRTDLHESNDCLLYMPDLKFDTELKGTDAHCVPPIAWLSIYELPGLIFHHLLCKKYGVDIALTGQIIKETVALYYKLFTDIKEGKLTPECVANENNDVEKVIADGYHTDHICLHQKDVPKKLLEYLMMKPVDMEARFKKLAGERMNKELKSTEERLRKYNDAQKRIGVLKYKSGKLKEEDIRPGSLARFLSKDLLRYQPYDDSENNKVTGLNFQVLQSSLALYNGDIKKLTDILGKANLLKKGMKHPFLQNVLNQRPKNLLAFYEIYLTQKIAYLKGRLKDKNETFKGLFRYGHRKKWNQRNAEYYKELAGRYMSELLETGTTHYKPIELPTGLFEQPIKQLLGEHLDKEMETNAKAGRMKELLDRPRSNVSYLISRYFGLVLEDKCQEFYSPTKKTFKRSYEFFNLLVNKKEGDKTVPVYCTVGKMKDLIANKEELIKAYLDSEETKKLGEKVKDPGMPERMLRKAYADYKKSELAIRRYSVQDMLIFLMAKELLIDRNLDNTGISGETMDKIKSYKLQHISPVGEEDSILSVSVPLKLTLKLKDGTTRVIKQEAIKLKNYGDFFQFLYDERIRTLLLYAKRVEIDRQDLELDLDVYDRNRVNIFKLTHQMERVIFEMFPYLKDPENEDYYFMPDSKRKVPKRNNFNSMLEELTKEDSSALGKREKKDMVNIRNSFGHNYYAVGLDLEKKDIPEIANAISKRFRKLVEKNKPRK